MKIKDKKYCNSFRDCQCLISLLRNEYCNTETVCGHHLNTRLRDDLQIPLCYIYHTGSKGIHTIGKKSWYIKHISKEELIELAEFAYGFWKTNGINMFSLDNIKEILDEYFKEA